MAASARPRSTGCGRVEIAEDRIDDQPRAFSGGMRQRLQIARNLVTHPRLVFMDEPTGGLDVSVQARLLDLMRGLVSDLGLSAIIVTHDLAVARLLSHRMMVMKDGRVIEAGLTDRVLDDPREPYTQLARVLDFAGVNRMTALRRLHPVLRLCASRKSFTMHLRDGIVLPVVDGVAFEVNAGECVVLGGPSGVGKISLLKMVYGNYGVDAGTIALIHHGAAGRPGDGEPAHGAGTAPRHHRLCQPVPAHRAARDDARCRRRAAGEPRHGARRGARTGKHLLARLNLPERLWSLPPATFSGGEQQRVNIARGFITDHPVLLLDEPTASLDATNRAVVVEMIAEKKRAGMALLGIFHDDDVRAAVADRIVDVTAFSPRKAA